MPEFTAQNTHNEHAGVTIAPHSEVRQGISRGAEAAGGIQIPEQTNPIEDPQMTNLIKTFAKSESGAVTVDWVVLTAALVGLGLAVMAVVSGGVENLSTDIAQELANAQPAANPFATAVTFSSSTDVTPD
ncbi:hypothetical protein C7455_108185 [Roseicyclus mahoneyensis]|uniref:Flp pilus assembly pilin Flp n=2 Tax=Roseicyclus mahoneyensis TaxID=164332 RepID=A0A316GWG5_9RHOB|nr:hypothetical protein C7455_108185 [Roseicyclus mahoneyensis]